jgi:hypothetical protein
MKRMAGKSRLTSGHPAGAQQRIPRRLENHDHLAPAASRALAASAAV